MLVREEKKRWCGTMKSVECLALFSVALLLSGAAFGADRIYKSIDDKGRVTYSEQPPGGAERVEAVTVQPGPSAEVTDQAMARMREAEQAADAQFKSLMENRQQRADARKEAQERRREREEAERQRRRDESLEDYTYGQWYYPPYPYYGPRIHPRYPKYPVYRPRRGYPSNRPYVDHINPHTRNW